MFPSEKQQWADCLIPARDYLQARTKDAPELISHPVFTMKVCPTKWIWLFCYLLLLLLCWHGSRSCHSRIGSSLLDNSKHDVLRLCCASARFWLENSSTGKRLFYIVRSHSFLFCQLPPGPQRGVLFKHVYKRRRHPQIAERKLVPVPSRSPWRALPNRGGLGDVFLQDGWGLRVRHKCVRGTEVFIYPAALVETCVLGLVQASFSFWKPSCTEAFFWYFIYSF